MHKAVVWSPDRSYAKFEKERLDQRKLVNNFADNNAARYCVQSRHASVIAPKYGRVN